MLDAIKTVGIICAILIFFLSILGIIGLGIGLFAALATWDGVFIVTYLGVSIPSGFVLLYIIKLLKPIIGCET